MRETWPLPMGVCGSGSGSVKSLTVPATGGRDLQGAYGEGTLEGDLVLLDALDGILGDGGLAVLEHGGDINGLPGDGGLG